MHERDAAIRHAWLTGVTPGFTLVYHIQATTAGSNCCSQSTIADCKMHARHHKARVLPSDEL